MGGVLLKHGCVLSLDRQVGNLRDADVLIEDGKVAEVGRGLRSRDAEEIDASDTIIMPGFVDTHRQLWRSLLRNLGGGSPGAATPDTPSYRASLLPDDVYAATLLGLVTAARTGITTVADWADLPADDRATEAALQAHHDAGLRTVFVHAPPAGGGDPDPGTSLRRLVADRTTDATTARSTDATTARATGDTTARTTFALGVTEPTETDGDRTATWSLARELGLRIHVLTTSRGLVAELGGRGLLGADVTLVQDSDLADHDLSAIAEHGAGLALTPARGMTTGLGPPPVQRLIDHDIRPGLGIGDELDTPGEMFAQMRIVQSLQRGSVFERKLAGKAGLPDLLGTRDVIRYATIDGARTIGLDAVTGSLAPGKQADIVVLRTDRPNIFPVNDPIGAVVWGMDASNVDWVFVGGTPLVRAGEPTADVGHVRALALQACERLASASGDLLGTSDGGAR